MNSMDNERMKSSHFQRICLTLDQLLPRWSVKTIYYPSFLVFYLLCKLHFGDHFRKCYLRNSFYLNYFTFGLSDFDFGVVLSSRTSLDQWKKFNRDYHYFKKIFPFWSEINLYCLDEMEFVKPFINSIEAQRDPFTRQLKLHVTEEEKFVFLIRSIFTNLKNWNFEKQKVNKITFYFKLCGLNFEPNENLNKMLNLNLKSFFKSKILESSPEFILSFHELLTHSKDILWEPSSTEQKVLMPQHYLWFEREEGSEAFLESLNEVDKKILTAQLNWEIWGLYTQLFQFSGNDSFRIHYSRIKKVFNHLGIDSQRIESIDKILNVFDQLNNH